MGFIGDIINEILDDGGPDRVIGSRLKRTNAPFRRLYEQTYFAFGLQPSYRLKENQLVPMEVITSGERIRSFIIQGSDVIATTSFLQSGWGSIFNTIPRELETIKGKVWAFDVTRLHEGRLVGFGTWPDSEEYARSEEYIRILQAIGASFVGVLSSVPKIELTFGNIWNKHRIPDNISISMRHPRPFTDHQLESVINVILHSYSGHGAPVTADYSHNTVDGTVNLLMRDTNPERKQAQPAEPKPEAADGFPYEFYRGLGLIDDDDMVQVPSIFGAAHPINVPMTNVLAKEHLMNYKPE